MDDLKKNELKMSNTVLPQAEFLHYAEHPLSWITMLSLQAKIRKWIIQDGLSLCCCQETLHAYTCLARSILSLYPKACIFFSVWECVHKYMHACIHALVCCFISSCFILLQCIINSSMQYVLLNYVIACVWYVCKPKCYVCIKVNKRIELALQGTALLTIENLRQKEGKKKRIEKEKKKKKKGKKGRTASHFPLKKFLLVKFKACNTAQWIKQMTVQVICVNTASASSC